MSKLTIKTSLLAFTAAMALQASAAYADPENSIRVYSRGSDNLADISATENGRNSVYVTQLGYGTNTVVKIDGQNNYAGHFLVGDSNDTSTTINGNSNSMKITTPIASGAATPSFGSVKIHGRITGNANSVITNLGSFASGSESSILVNGNGNTLTQTLQGRSDIDYSIGGDNNFVSVSGLETIGNIDVTGNSNKLNVSSSAPTRLSLFQAGNNNTMALKNAARSSTSLTQMGNDNFLALSKAASAGESDFTQIGNKNQLLIAHRGFLNASYTQEGDNNKAILRY